MRLRFLDLISILMAKAVPLSIARFPSPPPPRPPLDLWSLLPLVRSCWLMLVEERRMADRTRGEGEGEEE